MAKELDQEKIARLLGSDSHEEVGPAGSVAAYVRKLAKGRPPERWELAESAGGTPCVFPAEGDTAIARLVVDGDPGSSERLAGLVMARQRGRIMAAGMDLLDACRAMVEMYVKLGMDTPSMPGFEKTTVEVARAAIAKATDVTP